MLIIVIKQFCSSAYTLFFWRIIFHKLFRIDSVEDYHIAGGATIHIRFSCSFRKI